MKVAAIMDKPVAGAEEMEEKLIKVLLVESDRRFTRYLQESLSGLTSSRVDLFSSENLEEAISCLRENTLDAALLDLDIERADRRREMKVRVERVGARPAAQRGRDHDRVHRADR